MTDGRMPALAVEQQGARAHQCDGDAVHPEGQRHDQHADQHGRGKQSGIEIDLKLTQEEFADMLGVTRQSLNRELKTLEKQGLISIAYSCITLHDVPQLHSMAALTEAAQSDNTQK